MKKSRFNLPASIRDGCCSYKEIMKIMMLTLIMIIPILTFSNSGKPTHTPFGYFVVYDHQIGFLNNEFIQFGGGLVGVSLNGFSVGIGGYSNYPFSHIDSYRKERETEMLYGGLTLGYQSPVKVVGLRTHVLIGMSAVRDSLPTEYKEFDYGVVIAPSIYLDIHIWTSLTLSAGITYKYFMGMDEDNQYLNINHWQNAIAYTVSLGWVY